MSTLEKIFRPKLVTLLHTLLCFAVIIVLFLMSMGTIFELESHFNITTTTILEKIMSSSVGENFDVEFPATVKVSVPLIIKSIGGAVMYIVSLIASIFGATVEITGEMGQSFIDVICLVGAIGAAFKSNVLFGFCYLFVLYIVFAIPVHCVVNAVLCAISIIKNIINPGKAFHRVAKSFSKITHQVPLLLLVTILVPDLKLGSGVTGVLIACAAGLLISLAFSRLKVYEKPDFKYLNLLQIFSAACFGAFMLFYANIGKSNLIRALVMPSTVLDIKNSLVVVVILLVYIAALVFYFNYLSKSLTRLACMSESKSDSHIITAAIGLIVAAAPFVLLSTDFVDGARFYLLDGEKGAHIACAVGAVIALLLEIAFKIVTTVMCHDVKSSRRKAIVTGAYTHDPSEHEDAEATEESDEEIKEIEKIEEKEEQPEEKEDKNEEQNEVNPEE